MIGQTLSHFKITAKLGEGGMGEVYRAEDTRLGREVAIKVLPEAVTADPERLARFEREAQVIASLNHPNICALYDVGEEAELHYLVMELVEGESLGERIDRGMPVDAAIELAVQIAEALEAAHANGIVHRDLKPANVMLTSEGQVKVLDFGLAKTWAGPTEASPSLAESPTLTANMTQAGVILGTAAYMSPEQARGLEADQRADIWSWGVILYEMLTGRRLFEEPTVSDTLAAVLRADFDWDALPSQTPRGARIAVRRCLERDPKNRLHAIADARLELTRSEEVEPLAAQTAPDGGGRRAKGFTLAVAFGVALLGVLVGVLGWTMAPGGTDLPVRITEVQRGAFRSALLTPDGERVISELDGRFIVRDLDSLAETQIPGIEDAYTRWGVFVSPDGERLGYTTATALYTVPISGGAPTRVFEISGLGLRLGNIMGAAFRGNSIVFALDARGLWEVPAAGGEPQQILAPNRTQGEAGFHFPAVLPDGKTIVTRLRYFRKANDTLVFLRDGERSDVTFDGWRLNEVAVSPTGHLLVTRGGEERGVWAIPFSFDKLLPNGDPVRILSGRFTSLSLGRGGGLLTIRGNEAKPQTVRIDRQGELLGVYEGIGYSRSPAVSPDGRRIAVMGIRVWDGQRVMEVTPNRGYRATWSPDGRELIYEGSDPSGLYRVPADGSREPARITEIEAMDPHWSPDGRVVAFTTARPRATEPSEREAALGMTSQTDIVVLPLDGGGPLDFRSSQAYELHPRFSPDGRFMAYTSSETGRGEVYVAPYPEGDRRWQVSVEGGAFPRWSPDGREIFFVTARSLMVASFDGEGDAEIGAPQLLIAAHTSSEVFEEFDAAAYGLTPEGDIVTLHYDIDESRAALLTQNWLGLLEDDK